MAISINYRDIERQFDPLRWSSIDEFEEFKLQWFSERGDYVYYTDNKGVERRINPVNHFPKLFEYEVWSEGYAATGESGGAVLVDKAKARNFAQACHMVMCKNYLDHCEEINMRNQNDYVDAGRWDYDPSALSNWGCKLYWSEELAKKSFG